MNWFKRFGVVIALAILAFPASAETAREWFLLGEEARVAEDYYLAIERFRASLFENPYYFEPNQGLAQVYFALEEYDEALDFSMSALVYRRDDLSLTNLQGRILIGLGRFEEARERFDRVLERQPNNLDAQFGLAELDVVSGRIRTATDKFSSALRVLPDNRRALLSLVVLYDELGEPQRAEEFVKLALRYHSGSPQVRFLAGKHYFKRGEYPTAENNLRMALSLKEDYLEARLLLAELYLNTARYDEAITSLMALRGEENHLIWYSLGLAYARVGDFDRAVAALSSAHTLRKDDEIALFALERVLRDEYPMDDPRRKIFADLHFEAAAAFEDRNSLQNAFREYRQGLLLFPTSPQGRIGYASILKRLGYPARYVRELEFVIGLGVDDRAIADEYEIQMSLLEDQIDTDWGMDQFALERNGYEVSVFYVQGAEQHFEGTRVMADYLVDLLNAWDQFDFVSRPGLIDEFSAGFRAARAQGSDYFLIIGGDEENRFVRLSAELYHAGTGTLLGRYQSLRTGNGKAAAAARIVSANLAAEFPPRGQILERKFDRAIVNLGAVDGLAVDDEFAVVPRESVRLKRNGIGPEFPEGSEVGRFVVTRVNEYLSEGVLESSGYFDLMNEDDVVIWFPAEGEEPEPIPSAYNPSLYRQILRIP